MVRDQAAGTEKQYQLPTQVASRVDIGRLIREVEKLNDSLLQQKIRDKKTEIKMPKTSVLMDKTIEHNSLNLLDETEREQLIKFLVHIRDTSPMLHISFSSDPESEFIDKLMSWLRTEINPMILITIGIQPNIGAGCIVRTTNHYFDLSLRKDFSNNRELLMGKLRETVTK